MPSWKIYPGRWLLAQEGTSCLQAPPSSPLPSSSVARLASLADFSIPSQGRFPSIYFYFIFQVLALHLYDALSKRILSTFLGKNVFGTRLLLFGPSYSPSLPTEEPGSRLASKCESRQPISDQDTKKLTLWGRTYPIRRIPLPRDTPRCSIVCILLSHFLIKSLKAYWVFTIVI